MGYCFFEILEELCCKGNSWLVVFEVYYYCMFLGFYGRYCIEFIENLNYLVVCVGDEIDYLKGKKVVFFFFVLFFD